MMMMMVMTTTSLLHRTGGGAGGGAGIGGDCTGYKEQLLMSVDDVDVVDDDGWAWYKGQVQMDVYDDVDDDERTCYKGEVLVDVVDDDNYDDVGDDVDDGACLQSTDVNTQCTRTNAMRPGSEVIVFHYRCHP